MITAITDCTTPLLAILRCPKCGGELDCTAEIRCDRCATRFDTSGTAPVLLAAPYESYAGHDPEYERYFADARVVSFGAMAIAHWHRFLSYEPSAGSAVNLLRMKEEYDHKIYGMVRALLRQMSPASGAFRLLNVGAGLGTFDNALVDEFAHLDVTGVELVREGPAKVNEMFGGERLRHLCADAKRLPFASASFDGAYSKSAIEHIGLAMLPELYRVLKPGATALVVGPSYLPHFVLRPWKVFGWAAAGVAGRPYHVHGFKISEYRHGLADAGFEFVTHDAVCFWTCQRALIRIGAPRPMVAAVLRFNNLVEWLLRRSNRLGFLAMQVFIVRKPASAPTE